MCVEKTNGLKALINVEKYNLNACFDRFGKHASYFFDATKRVSDVEWDIFLEAPHMSGNPKMIFLLAIEGS